MTLEDGGLAFEPAAAVTLLAAAALGVLPPVL